MKFIPILFSTPMVQAIMAENKRMTRREIKNKEVLKMIDKGLINNAIALGKYRIGEILWVRETFVPVLAWSDGKQLEDTQFAYRANTDAKYEEFQFKWKPGMSVCDCACGSGRTLLAAAKINRNMIFVGSDIDLTCVKMAVVNLAYNSLIGEVAWMNTLSLEHYASFHIKVEPISRIPYIVITGKDDSLQLPKLKSAIQEMPAHQKQQVSNQTYLFD